MAENTPLVKLRRDATEYYVHEKPSKFGLFMGCIFGAFLIIGSIVLGWNISNLHPHP